MKETANNIYTAVPIHTPERSTFNMSHTRTTSLKMGKLVPCFRAPCLPGDKWNISVQSLMRLMPMVSPPMANIKAYFHFFFVPNRINWENWKEFITGGETYTGPVTPPAHPVFSDWNALLGGIEPSSLANYLGLPVCNVASGVPGYNEPTNAFPFAAYQRIWWEYYRDENLQETSNPFPMLIDGDQNAALYPFWTTLRNRAWAHDRFTSCLPWAQKGAPIEIPTDFTGLDILLRQPGTGPAGQPTWRNSATGVNLAVSETQANIAVTGATSTLSGIETYYNPEDTLYINEAAIAMGTTINDLREAYAAQYWQELNARGGGRYIESLLVHFGQKSSDARLQRPEFIGGSIQTISISEVLQTSESATTAQGTMAGHGISANGTGNMSYQCEEHGYIIGLLSIIPEAQYYQGIPRDFSITDKFSYPWPSLAHLGEEEVYNKELCYTASGGPGTYDQNTFGYLPRYYWYKDMPNEINGQLAQTLDFWHMGRKFDIASPPLLNDTFIKCDPTRRIFADTTDTDKVISLLIFNAYVNRTLPKYGEPSALTAS